MTNGIYGYYDTKNQYVIYIGQDAHIDNEKRHKDHLSPSNYDEQHINRVLQRNPGRYIYFKFVEGIYTSDEIDDFEKEAIKLFKTYKYDYPERNVFNFTPGGDFNPMKVPEIAKKFSGENNPMYRKKHSAETRKKMSEAQKGENHPFYGRHHSEETKKKISEARNTSGYFRVSKKKDKNCKQGFIWKYRWYTGNSRQKSISSIDIKKLEEKVKAQGLKWEEIK